MTLTSLAFLPETKTTWSSSLLCLISPETQTMLNQIKLKLEEPPCCFTASSVKCLVPAKVKSIKETFTNDRKHFIQDKCTWRGWNVEFVECVRADGRKKEGNERFYLHGRVLTGCTVFSPDSPDFTQKLTILAVIVFSLLWRRFCLYLIGNEKNKNAECEGSSVTLNLHFKFLKIIVNTASMNGSIIEICLE